MKSTEKSMFSQFTARLLLVFISALLSKGSVFGTLPTSWPTQWTFEPIEDDVGDWWQSIRVQSVPGVMYHLQESDSLEGDSWTTIESSYGTGGEWICPLFPGNAPVVLPPSSSPVIPSPTGTPTKFAWLVMEKTDQGELLISWSSLEDRTPIRMILDGVELDPAWEEFDSSYLYSHGNYVFALSPRLSGSVTFTGSNPSLGSLDASMIAAFQAELPDMTSNIQQSLEMAAMFAGIPAPAANRKFFRVAADWSLDSDGDGRFDWQEIISDGNNPNAADTDGDGSNDVAGDNSGEEPSLEDPPSEPIDEPPLATIECKKLILYRNGVYRDNEEPEVNDYLLIAPGGQQGYTEDYENIRPFDEVAYALAEEAPGDDGWGEFIPSYHNTHLSFDENSTVLDYFEISRVAYRLRLDSPAPAGGYSIPVRVLRFSMEQPSHVTILTDGPYTGIGFEDLLLTVAEGETVGEPVFASHHPTAVNTRSAYHTLPMELIHFNLEEEQEYQFKSFNRGACVMPDDVIKAYLPGYLHYSNQITVKWRRHRLAGDGTIRPPEEMTPLLKLSERTEPPNDLNSRGYAYLKVEDPGIYRLDAEINFPDGTKVSAPYLRMKHAKGLMDRQGVANPNLKAGKADYLGVCRNETSFKLRNLGVEWMGRTEYAKSAKVVVKPPGWVGFLPDTENVYKCNIFLTHLANRVGAYTPYFYYYLIVPGAPMARQDWFSEPEENIDLDSPGWGFQGLCEEPAPGMSVACDAIPPFSGHCGIVDYDGAWINAGEINVNKSIHLSDPSPIYKNPHFRSR